MAAIMNGIALHGGFINYGATFLIFMEYMRNAVRMSALMRQQSIFVFTHDSIGLGEDGPTHQPVEQLASLRSPEQVAAIARGAYVLRHCDGAPDAILIATGSEVHLAMAAAERLSEQGRQVRVVSMPSAEVFEAQEAEYRESVLPSDVLARVAVEALHADFWYKYVGLDGRIVGMTSFGESAPAGDLFREFGFTVDNVVAAVEEVLLD